MMTTHALPFSPPLVLAPLDGVGTPTTLSAWAAVGGMGLLCAPFVRVSSVTDPPWSQRKLASLCRPFGPPGQPLVQSVQLLGEDPARVADGARAAEALGAALIDLNFGCPSRLIVRKQAGAGLLARPERLAAVVRAVRDAVHVPVIAKIRLGLTRPEEVLALVPRVVDAGAHLLAVHARTLADGYRAPARWEWLARAVALSPVPVIGNGDVWTAADALRMRAETGCAAVMVARGVMRNPWIFQQIIALTEGRPAPRPRQGDLHAFLFPLASALVAEARDRVRARSPVPEGRACGPVPAGRACGPVKELVVQIGQLVGDGATWRRAVLRETDPAALLRRIDDLAREPERDLSL
jgi:tRNA-dihydrouridine synthase C